MLTSLLSAAGLGAAQQPVPALSQHVNDYAGMISPAVRTEIEQRLALLEREETTQIAILTVSSLQGEPVGDFSIRVAEAWRLGQKKRDNGLLLIVSKEDRKVRIEVGYGLEGRVTDLQAGRIIRSIIKPAFAKGDYDGGFIGAADAMIAAARGEFKAPPSSKSNGDDEGPSIPLVLGILFLLFLYLRRFGSHHHPGPFVSGGWPGAGGGIFTSGGGFRDSGFGGGGGGFGGGGASGDW